MTYSMQCDSPLGSITLASDGESLVGLWIQGQKYFAATLAEGMTERPDLPAFAAAKGWLRAYFAGERPPIDGVPLAPRGGPFRKAVWEILCEIPYGETTTYGRIAAEIAARQGKQRMSSQAVGGAVGHNPISIIIPCHRVVGSGGSLTGYAGGIPRKVSLLAHEGVDTSRFSVPTRGTAL